MIVSIISWVVGAAALLLCLPVAIFLSEVLAAVMRPFNKEQISLEQGGIPVAILIPAHNESSNILPTLADVNSQVTSRDFVLVVADNCTDDTAAIAASAGAHVVERFEPRKVGKGYALDFGVRHLESVGAKVVIVLDADCRIAPGAIANLSHMACSSDRPAQALYLMEAPKESPINYQVAQFAWRVKNFVRPLGLARAGLPCQLMGTGMAFPFRILQQASLASGHIVEDLKLGLDMALMGRPPKFCPHAVVTSTFPTSQAAADRQRERWEHGHLELVFKMAPRLIFNALSRGDIRLFALAADLAVPPLSALASMILVAIAITGLSAVLGASYLAFFVAISAACAFLAAVGLAWLQYGRDILPARTFTRFGPYLSSKLRLYLRFLSGNRVTRWNRTDRT